MNQYKPRWLFIAFLALIGPTFVWAYVMHAGLSGDVFWQWAAGHYMWVHHRIIRRDPFSYSLYGRPWVTEEWGFEVLLAGLVSAVGPVAYWLISAGVGTVALALVAGRLRHRSVSWSKIAIILVFVGLSLMPLIKVRPQTLSYALFAGELWLLDTIRRRPKLVWVMPLYMALWTNLHGSFLLGYLIFFLYGVWMFIPVVKGRFETPKTNLSRKTWGLAFGVSVLASLINPHGFEIWSYAAHVSFSSQISSMIAEWQSPNFHQHFMMLTIIGPLAVVLLAAEFSAKKPIEWPEFVLLGGMLVAVLQSVRFLPYYAIEWPVVVAALTPDFEFKRVRSFIGVPVVLALLVYIIGSQPIRPPGAIGSGVPVRAVDYLAQHRSGRVFAMYHWGGYLISRGFKVFVDGRTDFYLHSPVLPDYLAVKNLSKNPNPIWAHYRVEYVLWEPNTALATFLSQDSQQWQEVYVSKNAVIYQHRGIWGIQARELPLPGGGT